MSPHRRRRASTRSTSTRFRRLLGRRPRFAARCFTESERSDATGSADAAQSLAARFAAKEAVMKALGSGLGSFALTDVEVRRTEGEGATRNAPFLVLHGGAAELADARAPAGSTSRSPTPTTWRSPSSSPSRHSRPCAPS